MDKFTALNKLYEEYVVSSDPIALSKMAKLAPKVAEKIATTYLGRINTTPRDEVIGHAATNLLLKAKDKQINFKPTTLLHTMVYNKVVDVERKKSEILMEEHYWQNIASSSSSDISQRPAMTRDLKLEVEKAIDENVKNPIDAEIMKRHYLEGELLKDVAAEHGIKNSAGKMRMDRLKDKLAKLPIFEELYEASNEITR